MYCLWLPLLALFPSLSIMAALSYLKRMVLFPSCPPGWPVSFPSPRWLVVLGLGPSGVCFLGVFPCIHFSQHPNSAKQQRNLKNLHYRLRMVLPLPPSPAPLALGSHTPPLVPDFLSRVVLPLATGLCMGCLFLPHLVCLSSVCLSCRHNHVPGV